MPQFHEYAAAKFGEGRAVVSLRRASDRARGPYLGMNRSAVNFSADNLGPIEGPIVSS